MSQTCSRALAAVGLLLVAAHFLLTAIYVNPISVVGLAWRAPVSEHLEPLFRQRWALFAPDPPLLDRRLDYQCELDGAWVSRSEALLETHARRRFGPAARLRRLETAAIVATVGAHDRLLDELLDAQDHADEAQRRRVEDLFAQRTAASIVASETAYRLVLAYCREDLGREPERMRYRIVSSPIPAYSRREQPAEQPRAVTVPWLGVDEFDTLERRAGEWLDAYEHERRERDG